MAAVARPEVALAPCCSPSITRPCVVLQNCQCEVLLFTTKAIRRLQERALKYKDVRSGVLWAEHLGDWVCSEEWATGQQPRDGVCHHVVGRGSGETSASPRWAPRSSFGLGFIVEIGWCMVGELASVGVLAYESTRQHKRGSVRLRKRTLDAWVEKATFALWSAQP